MEYQTFCQLLDQLKSHLTRRKQISMEDFLEMAKSNERWRNAAVLYSLRSEEHFYILLRKSNEDKVIRQMLFDLHSALSVPGDPYLRSLVRMLRYLPFYERTGSNLDLVQLPVTTASRQISKLLRSLVRLYKLRGKKRSDEKNQYVAERRSSIKLVQRSRLYPSGRGQTPVE